jgi:hypothetical protein
MARLMLALLLPSAAALSFPITDTRLSRVQTPRHAPLAMMAPRQQKSVGRGKALEPQPEVGLFTGIRWIAVQGLVDATTLAFFFVALYSGSPDGLTPDSLYGFLTADSTKWFVVGPAILTFGGILQRLTDRPWEGYEDDLLVKWLGGADAVQDLDQSMRNALRF